MSSRPASPVSLYVLIYAFVMSVLIYSGLVWFLGGQRTPPPAPDPTLKTIFMVLGMLILGAAVMVFHLQAANRPQLEPEKFQVITMVSLALAEACAILGLALFFMGAAPADFYGFAAGSLIVMLFYILPAALRYWAARR